MNVKFHILIIGSLLLFGCTKSEVADSNDSTTPISFETYIGRDVHTKAASYGNDNLPASVGVYGFYSGAKTWTSTDTPNLWENLTLTNNGGTWSYKPEEVRYWTNTKDNYTFLSYAPYATGTNGLVASAGANPTITYTVPTDLSKQIDLLYSNNNKNIHKPNNSTSVTLNYEHALSRLTVKASAETAENAYTFHIKSISITGDFYTKGDFNLATRTWNNLSDEKVTYSFFTSPTTPGAALTSELVDYAGTSNYLMIIPADFSDSNATLTVEYLNVYGGVESKTKTFLSDIDTDFKQGYAYAINVSFELNDTITFNVTEENGLVDWNNTEIGIH